jgi:hypothetical protein
MEPQSHEPYENIDHEKDDGHEDKAVHMLEPLKHKAEQCNNGIKTNTMKDYPDYELISWQIISKPEKCRQRTYSASKDNGYQLKPCQVEISKIITHKRIDEAFDYDAHKDGKRDHHSLFKP